MISLPIDFVSHPKILFSLRSKTSETGGSVSLFLEKSFAMFRFSFASVLLQSEIWGHPREGVSSDRKYNPLLMDGS